MTDKSPNGAGASGGRRQFVKFSFFKVAPEWRRLDPAERDRQKAEFRDLIQDWEERNLIRTYTTIGTRGDVDFLVWQVSQDLGDIQRMTSEMLGTGLGGWLSTPYSYLSMTKHSNYVEKYAGPNEDKFTRLTIAPGAHKYLFVYPLTKLREWYALPHEERQQIMNDHIAVGATFSSVKINTTYAFGIDDPEFVLAFETDIPADFLDLVQELRSSVSSAYTLTDTPIFTCVTTTAEGMLDALAASRQTAGV